MVSENEPVAAGTPGQAAHQAETVAIAFHTAYEDLAPQYGYRTREASAKPWDEVPAKNAALMVATAARLLETGVISAAREPHAAPDLGAAYADLESEIRVAVSLHCTGPGVPCDLCLRETDRAMKAVDAYARDVAQHERTREQPAPELAQLRELLRLNRQLVVTLRRISHQQEDGGHTEAAYATGGAATMVEALWPVCNEQCTDTTHHQAQPAPELAAALGDWPAILADVTQQRDDLRELLDQVGVLAANAPEDDGSFAVCEQIAMRIAAAGVPDTTPIDEWPAPDREQFIAAAEEHLAARRPRPADTAEQPAPVVAAAMRESRLYREALHRAQEALDEDGTIGRRLSVARSIVNAALEGK